MTKDELMTKKDLEEMFRKFAESISDKISDNVIKKMEPKIKEIIHSEFANSTFKITPLKG